jgi:hypothetical protein
MLRSLDYQVALFIYTWQEQQSLVGTQKFHENAAQVPRAIEGQQHQAVQAALVLASLVPAVPCDKDAWKGANEDLLATWQFHLCANPLIRVVCMLGLTGLLSEQQKQGVVALLGGSTTGSTGSAEDSSSCAYEHLSVRSALLLPEPASIAQPRQNHGISLADLSSALLWVEHQRLSDPERQLRSITKHLLLAFGADQLPSIARIMGYLWVQDLDDRTPFEVLGIPVAAIELWQQPSFRDTYLSWMQATLLKVIGDVLSQHR